jgi:ER membrane protein complex subunit 1
LTFGPLTLLSDSVTYTTLVVTPDTVYVVGLAKSFASYTLHVTSLSSSSGEVVASVDIPSSIAEGPSDMVVLSSDTSTLKPRVVWLEAGALRSVQLVPSLTAKPVFAQGSVYRKIIDVGLQSKGHFVALKTGDTGRVFTHDAEKGLKVIYEFPDSVSTYSRLRLYGIAKATA